MKRIFIVALFVLGIYNASVFAMAQEILLTEMYSMLPFDDPKDNKNSFHNIVDLKFCAKLQQYYEMCK